jgi:hypothetical protein
LATDARPRCDLSWLRLACLLGLALALPWAGAPPAAAQERRLQAADVEAAYLVNFLRYTQWPAQRFASPDAPLVVTVVGPAEVAGRLRAVAAAAGPIDGRAVEVHNLPSPRGSLDTPLDSERDREAAQLLRHSHLVYFHDGAAPLHPRVLADLWGQPVLTVGNSRGFAARGGMLGLVRNGGNIVFEANPGAIRNSGLVVSAKVLKLARPAR